MENTSDPLLLLILGYLPGALLFRLPIAARERRAALGADERVFWHVMLSVAWSLIVVLGLAAFGEYRFSRLAAVNLGLCALIVIAARGRLRYATPASRPTWHVALPVVLVVIGLWRFFPASEYIIGGKDPGTYMNEGIQIAQRGALVTRDPVVAAVPDYVRDLFFPSHLRSDYYGIRFQGFFIQDPRTGDVIGQFPHLFPASIAIGYGVHGLTGARLAVGTWALLGVLAVYFAGARLIGQGAAFAACALLCLNVAEVWFARYPNTEFALQALLFAGILAFARAHQDEDRFFAPIAGVLLGLLAFNRVDALIGVLAVVAAGILAWLVERRRLRAGFVLTLAACGLVGGFYLTGPMRAYLTLPNVFITHLPVLAMTAAITIGLALVITLTWLARRHLDQARATLTLGLTAGVLALAGYAWFFRQPGGPLVDTDAHALRDFTYFYLGHTLGLGPVALAVALAGFALVVRQSFWRDPALVLTVVGFSVFFFYKIHIVPEHFWAARRFLPVILPAILLFAAAAAIGPLTGPWRTARLARPLAGAAFLTVLGWQYIVAAAPVMPHVEYAGMIPYLEKLASRFGDRDLVLFESVNAGADTHTLALPIAYIYARNVLVLSSPRPDKVILKAFLEDALKKYDRVFFVGGGGTDLLSRHIAATERWSDSIQVPEYESASIRDAKNYIIAAAYPTGIRRKDFEYGVYQLSLDAAETGPFAVDVGKDDDLNVLRFFAKESTEGRTIRWTQGQSVVAIPGMTGREREVVLVMHDGGRPAGATPASVQVLLDLPCASCDGGIFEVALGDVAVGSGFRPYRFAIPAEVAARAASIDDPAQLKLVSTTWNPQQLRGGSDTRKLGVMIDRVEVH